MVFISEVNNYMFRLIAAIFSLDIYDTLLAKL